jgi:hypothetical protein
MSDSTISNLPEATTPLAGDEIVPVVQGGETRRVVLAPIAVSGSAADLEAGTVPTARLGSGTANDTTFLRGDNTWATPPGEGGGATDLSYTAATRVIASSTGTDATLPLVTSGDAGLAPASGGGTSNFLRADGTWAAPAGGTWTTVFKTADEAKTSDTTLANDSTLTIAMDATSTYVFSFVVHHSTTAAPDAKYALDYSGTVASIYVTREHNVPGGSFASADTFSQTTTTVPGAQFVQANAGSGFIRITGIITTTTAGTLGFQYAQNTSSGEPATVRAGSYLEYRKI